VTFDLLTYSSVNPVDRRAFILEMSGTQIAFTIER